MKNNIVFFSGGLASFAVADYVKSLGGNTVLYFADTLWEDEDLYRFIYEVSDKLELPMLIHSKGITPPQLMVQKKFLANNRVGICSKELKMKVAADYLKDGIVPAIEKWHNKHFLKHEDFINNATLFFGIGFMEQHREGPIRANWEKHGFSVEFPLIEHVIETEELLKNYAIRRPRLYDMQFAHNNCKGRCVKAGSGHFKNLLMKDEKTFIELMEQEIVLSEYVRYCKQPSIKNGKQKDYMFKDVYEFVSTGEKSEKIKHILSISEYLSSSRRLFGEDSKGNPIKKPYTFMKNKSLYDLEKEPVQCDMWDIGGCSCFVDYEDEGESA